MTDATNTTKPKDTFLHLAGSKLRSRLTSQLNETASAATSDFAQSQLKKMGWSEGTGLGKRRDGISTHIRVQKRADEQGGIGKPSEASAAIEHHQNEWWKGSVGDILAKLGNKKKKKKKDVTIKKRKVYTDDELFQATGGARFGMRAQGSQKGKWQRTEGEKVSEQEEVARGKVEWNGLTAPKVLLSTSNTTASTISEEQPPPKTKKRKISDDDEEDQLAAEKIAKKERKRAKKERKEEKKAKKQAKKSKSSQD